MRLMSFAHTTTQVLARTKTVTRRDGWKNLKPGTVLRAVDKCMGFRKGERPRELAIIRVVSVRREPLSAITDDDVEREGFVGCSAAQFVAIWCDAIGRRPDEAGAVEVTRVEFEYAP